MITPSSTWGGINVFWPSRSYIGGTGDIWWWNNYDIFLIVISIVLLNLVLLAAKYFVNFDLRKFSSGVFIAGVIFIIIQIKTRDVDFSYSGHTIRYRELELKSKQIQKDILGVGLYKQMENLDNQLPINF